MSCVVCWLLFVACFFVWCLLVYRLWFGWCSWLIVRFFRCSLLFVGFGCLVVRCVVFDVGVVFARCCLLFAVRGLVLCSWLVVCCLLIVAC